MAWGASYHDAKNLIALYQWDEGTTSFGSNITAEGAFDYFTDDCQVDDALYFGYNKSYPYFDQLNLNVGTAFAATSVTFKWEFWSTKDQQWKELTNVVDDTNGFTTIGANSVSWDISTLETEWGSRNITPDGLSDQYYWVRCRIDALDTPTEGGANQTARVSCNPRVIWVTGATSEEYGHMHDLYVLDDANGWGVITEIGGEDEGSGHNHYIVEATIRMYGGNFGSKNETVCFKPGYSFRLEGNATMVMGDDYSASGDTNYLDRGAYWFFSHAYGVNSPGPVFAIGSTLKMYGSVLKKALTSTDGTQGAYHMYIYADLVLRKSIIKCQYGSLYSKSTQTLDLEDAYLEAISSSAFYLYSSTETPVDWGNSYVGLLSRNRTNGGKYRNLKLSRHNVTTTGYWYDCAFGVWLWVSSNVGDDQYIYHTFNLKVVDKDGNAIDGATVTMEDKDGTEVFSDTTDASGDITQQDVLYEIKEGGDGEAGDEVAQGPHTATITKSGYATRVIPYTMNQARVEVEGLEDEVKWIMPMANKIFWNLDKTNSQNKFKWLEL